MKRILLLSSLLAIFIIACKSPLENSQHTERAKFEPADGEVLLFIGQDLGALGGLEDYNDGYFDHFQTPGGFTMYTNFRPGDESYGHSYKGLDGLKTTDDWGSGKCNMQMQIEDPDFANSALAIGLELVNHDSATAYGVHDSMIVELANWVKNLGSRPVFLRIGYEFDAPDWNHYDYEHYKKAFRRVKTMFDSIGVENYVSVWQSKGFGSDTTELLKYYPGDEYVDWFSYTHFVWGVEGGQPMVDLARRYGKPVLIGEATPMVFQGDTLPQDCFLDNHKQAMHAWESYFMPFFKMIDDNPDVIKAISYISVDWPTQKMWENNSPFKYVDSRLHVNDSIKARWNRITGQDKYLKASPELFDYLWGKK